MQDRQDREKVGFPIQHYVTGSSRDPTHLAMNFTTHEQTSGTFSSTPPSFPIPAVMVSKMIPENVLVEGAAYDEACSFVLVSGIARPVWLGCAKAQGLC